MGVGFSGIVLTVRCFHSCRTRSHVSRPQLWKAPFTIAGVELLLPALATSRLSFTGSSNPAEFLNSPGLCHHSSGVGAEWRMFSARVRPIFVLLERDGASEKKISLRREFTVNETKQFWQYSRRQQIHIHPKPFTLARTNSPRRCIGVDSASRTKTRSL